MTWLGKILTFVVMIAAVVWMYFTVQAYVTRTNWKTALEGWQDSYAKLSKAKEIETERNRVNEAYLRDLIDLEKTKSDGLQKQVAALMDEHTKFVNDVKVQHDVLEKGDVDNKILKANLERMTEEVDSVRQRNIALEDKSTRLVLDAESAKRDTVKAQNEAKLYRSITEDLRKKNEELALLNNEYKLNGGTRNPLVDRPPPPVLSNLRGEVEGVNASGDLVTLTIGADAGLSKGSVLQISRLGDGGRYLGTVKVIDLEYKKSVAQFTPKDPRIPLNRLKPEELPRKGDQVTPAESLIGGRIGNP